MLQLEAHRRCREPLLLGDWCNIYTPCDQNFNYSSPFFEELILMSDQDSKRGYQYRRMLLALEQKLSQRDVEKLAFCYNDRVLVPDDKKGDALFLFTELEKRGDLSEGNTKNLLLDLKSISRDDLHAMCDEMLQEKGSTYVGLIYVKKNGTKFYESVFSVAIIIIIIIYGRASIAIIIISQTRLL